MIIKIQKGMAYGRGLLQSSVGLVHKTNSATNPGAVTLPGNAEGT